MLLWYNVRWKKFCLSFLTHYFDSFMRNVGKPHMLMFKAFVGRLYFFALVSPKASLYGFSGSVVEFLITIFSYYLKQYFEGQINNIYVATYSKTCVKNYLQKTTTCQNRTARNPPNFC